MVCSHGVLSESRKMEHGDALTPICDSAKNVDAIDSPSPKHKYHHLIISVYWITSLSGPALPKCLRREPPPSWNPCDCHPFQGSKSVVRISQSRIHVWQSCPPYSVWSAFRPIYSHSTGLTIAACWASSGHTIAGCQALENQLRTCMDAPVGFSDRPFLDSGQWSSSADSEVWSNLFGPLI